MDFTEDQLVRYSRHILLPEVGGKGQKKINESKVLLVGAGGLGSPAALYLAAAGVGTVGIVDDDEVDLSNLQRQILHFTKDIGRPKVDSGKEKLTAINPEINVEKYHERLNAGNVMNLISGYDIVIDGSDNFGTRFVVNDACVLTGKPFIHGGILRFFGQVLTVVPGEGPCFRCIFKEPPPPDAVPTCAQAGVLGVIAGVIGGLQATEALKYILGKGDLLTGRLLNYDALEMKFREIKVNKNPSCPVCGDNPTITEPVDFEPPVCGI